MEVLTKLLGMVIGSFIKYDSYGLLKILAHWKLKVTPAISVVVLKN